AALRRGGDRRRPQRSHGGGVPGARRQAGPRPGAPARPRRRHPHRGGLPRVPAQRAVVRGLAPPPRDHPRAEPAQARPDDPAARRHDHPARRRLPVARERPRQDHPGDPPLDEEGRGGGRGVQPAHGRHGAVHQADPVGRAAGPGPAVAARVVPAAPARQELPRSSAAAPGDVHPAHDDERGRLPRAVVRDRAAQGDDVGLRHHRDVPGRAVAGDGLRAPAPLHGRDRRRLPRVGHPARGDRRHRGRDRLGGPGGRRRDPYPGPGGPHRRPERARDRRDPRVRRGDPGLGRALLGRRQPDVPRVGRARPPRRGVPRGGPEVQVPRVLRQGEPRARRPARARVQAREGGVAAGRDQLLALDRLHGARVRRREVRELLPPPVHRLHHPDARRPVDGAARQAHHELLRAVGPIPPGRRQGLGRRDADRVRRDRDRHARGAVPEDPRPHHPQAVRHPARHRGDDRPHRGQHLPGGTLARAALLQPAGAGVGEVPHAGEGPVALRLGRAPRRRHHGRARADRRPRGAEVRADAEARPKGGGVMADYDAIVIGAGHNGLVTAAYLAKAGRRVLVLERRERTGGILDTVEIAPGVRAPGIVHTVGRLRTSVIDDLGLVRHGLVLIDPPVRVFAPQPDGPALTLWGDASRTADELRSRSAHDAEAYPTFDKKVRSLASFLAYLNAATPPDVKNLTFADLLTGLRAGRAFRELGARAAREVTRMMPMAIADVVGEVFEDYAIRGAIASRAVLYSATGPWSAGTATTFLSDAAGNDGGAPGQSVSVRGGPGTLAEVLTSAARSFGAEVRTGAEVVRVLTRDERAVGVALASGEELFARAVASSADPKRTLTTLVDPVVIGPHLLWRAGNIRTPGVVSKVNLSLSALPRFPGADEERLRGRIVIAPSIDHLERAFDASKYGRISEEPFLEATIPTLSD